MAKRKLDIAIVGDLQAVNSDSFKDNLSMLPIDNLHPSEDNFYSISDIELLAEDIERQGLKHNLVVNEDAEHPGQYLIISGHRRFSAIQYLVQQGRYSSQVVPCFVAGTKTKAETVLDLIMLNATSRRMSDPEFLRQYEVLEQTLRELDAAGKGVPGRMRERIASTLKVSAAQVGKIENILHNGIEEVQQAVRSGEMSISTASAVSSLPAESQENLIDEKPVAEIRNKDVQEYKSQLPKKPEKVIFRSEKWDGETQLSAVKDALTRYFQYEKENATNLPLMAFTDHLRKQNRSRYSTVTISVNDVLFQASGSVIAVPGWYSVDAMPVNKKSLPALTQDEQLSGEYQIKQGETEPPKRYTEADLLAAMELAGQNIEDEETRTLMKLQMKGLGTDATRAAIIKGLFEKGMIAKKGKSIIPTEKGFWLIEKLPIPDIKSAELTGEWEMRLNNIALGKEDYHVFIEDMKRTAQEWYAAIAGDKANHFLSSAEQGMKCPVCGKQIRQTKFGYGCSGYTKEGDGCKFAFSNPLCGVKLSEKVIRQLIEDGRTGLIEGFKSKKNPGKTFSAYLIVDPETGNIEFDMNTDLNCPICGKPIRPVSFGYSCTGYSKDGTGCRFAVSKEICGKKITDSQIRMLIQNGRTGLIRGFKSKKDPEKTFDAYLVLDKENQNTKFEFHKSK